MGTVQVRRRRFGAVRAPEFGGAARDGGYTGLLHQESPSFPRSILYLPVRLRSAPRCGDRRARNKERSARCLLLAVCCLLEETGQPSSARSVLRRKSNRRRWSNVESTRRRERLESPVLREGKPLLDSSKGRPSRAKKKDGVCSQKVGGTGAVRSSLGTGGATRQSWAICMQQLQMAEMGVGEKKRGQKSVRRGMVHDDAIDTTPAGRSRR